MRKDSEHVVRGMAEECEWEEGREEEVRTERMDGKASTVNKGKSEKAWGEASEAVRFAASNGNKRKLRVLDGAGSGNGADEAPGGGMDEEPANVRDGLPGADWPISQPGSAMANWLLADDGRLCGRRWTAMHDMEKGQSQRQARH